MNEIIHENFFSLLFYNFKNGELEFNESGERLIALYTSMSFHKNNCGRCRAAGSSIISK